MRSFWGGVLVVVSACGEPTGLQALPEQPRGFEVQSLTGSAPDDLWLLAADVTQGRRRVLHGTDLDELTQVPLPETLSTATLQTFSMISAGRGRAALTWTVEGEFPGVGVLEADGGFVDLYGPTLFGGGDPTMAQLQLMPRGDGFAVVSTIDSAALPPVFRVSEQEGAQLFPLLTTNGTPAETFPQGLKAFEALDVAGVALWFRASRIFVDHTSLMVLSLEGRWHEQPDTDCSERYVVRGTDDIWCSSHHWNGMRWNTPAADAIPAGAAVLPIAAGRARAVVLDSTGGELSELVFELEHEQVSEPKSRGLVKKKCRGSCPAPTWHRLRDGSVVFLVPPEEGASRAEAIVISPSDL